MYRHTTPTPLKYLAENGPEGENEIPLIRSEREVEVVWGDYPGHRQGAGRYADISKNGVPVGRLWETATAVGLLHVPVEGGLLTRRESQIHYWNASAQIRQAKHNEVSAADCFAAVLENYDHTAVVAGPLDDINYPEVDAIFYVDRYDPEGTDIWCEEMK